MKKVNNRRIKVVSKKKFLFNIIILFLIFLGIGFLTTKSFGKREIHTYEYVVSSKVVCKNSKDESLDIQSVVNDIKCRNNLSKSDIYVGQVLQIPIY